MRRIGAGILVLLAVAFSTPATAEVSLFKSDHGWEFSTDGRANGFLNYQWGDNVRTYASVFG